MAAAGALGRGAPGVLLAGRASPSTWARHFAGRGMGLAASRSRAAANVQGARLPVRAAGPAAPP